MRNSRITHRLGTLPFREPSAGGRGDSRGQYRLLAQDPDVKRLVMKSVPEATTRLAMLKKREADVTYGIFGPLAEEVQRDPNLKLEAPVIATQWIVFTYDQYDPKSPWLG